MKILALVITILLLVNSCLIHKKDSNYHPFVQKAKETSLYTLSIDWDSVNQQFLKLTEGKETVEDLKPGLQYLINSLGDKHGGFRYTKDNSFIVSYQGKTESQYERDGNFIDTVINDITAKFSHQLLEGNIGYLRVLGIGGGDVKQQADFIRDGIKDLAKQGANQWIVDLRYNGGGNMEPMIAGLAPLIGEGFIAGSINIENHIREYVITKGQFYNYNRLVCEMDSLPVISNNQKIVILTSRYTISSGELVAVAFKGRANTLFIGEETAGYTTGNGYNVVRKDIALVISQDVFIDRNKVKYNEYVGVDEFMEFQHNTSINNDLQITRATEWLKN